MILVVQIVLVVAVILFSLVLIRGGSNAKHMAVRRILVLLFAVGAVLSIFFPGILTRLAGVVGVGRGTDLMLYAFIVSFLVYISTTHQRFRQMEGMLTKLSRRIALDEAERPWEDGHTTDLSRTALRDDSPSGGDRGHPSV